MIACCTESRRSRNHISSALSRLTSGLMPCATATQSIMMEATVRWRAQRASPAAAIPSSSGVR